MTINLPYCHCNLTNQQLFHCHSIILKGFCYFVHAHVLLFTSFFHVQNPKLFIKMQSENLKSKFGSTGYKMSRGEWKFTSYFDDVILLLMFHFNWVSAATTNPINCFFCFSMSKGKWLSWFMLVWPDSVNLLGGVDEKTNFDNFGKDIPAKPLEWRRLVTPKTFSVITVRFCFVNCRVCTKCY